ncbi:DEAD/DEAH box helicase [Paenibacillus rhizovicinus]|uniref:DEAD/DEAH box helicase n=1 Tax=Paenibacillus rhizovicinus TaxID=2704463 RepID=A0A6C0P535_9BACL|nr:DEAD/DEAH box helicase [Paenibacillus rhizovicinus]QHW33376.1 DEAD/DEAH box helicase [Paenibacillus rhizovicinus]
MHVSWETLQLQPQLIEALRMNKIEAPTPVQAETIPLMLAGHDISAKSQTGSGKTLAYMLPAIQRVDTASSAVQIMVLAPTQELAMQIFRVAETYGEALGVKTQQLIGGASMQRQVEKLREHPHIVVGTPGRIHELVKSGKLKLHGIRLVIIDEADQVFNLGSTIEVETLLKGMLRDRQIAFFSATRPQAMADVEERWMREPKQVNVSPDQQTPSKVAHYYVVCDKRDKADTARRLIHLLKPASALLFINETDEIANYEAKLKYEGFSVETLYGDADKQRRSSTLARFREGRLQILLATDVAARGLDIADLALVVHLDPALDADHYVHRSGRTGRMGKSGTVVSIVTRNQLFIMDKFRKQLGIDLQEKTMYKGKLWSPGEEQGVRGEDRPRREFSSTRSSGDAARRPGQGASAAGGLSAARKPPAPAQSGEAAAEPAARRATIAGGQSTPASRSGQAAAPRKQDPKQSKPAKSKKELERERKNKGAPKWLKAKRDGEQGEK